MRNRSVQAISIGLSAITMAGPVSMTVYAQTAEATHDAATTTEQQVSNDSEEKAIAEEVSGLSEQLNNTTVTDELGDAAAAPAAEGQFDQSVSDVINDASAARNAVDSVSASMDNVVKAEESVEEATNSAKDAAEQASASINDATESTANASKQAESAVEALMDQSTSKDEAEVIVADTEKTVEEAQTAFDSAETTYNQALEAYNLAKDDFDTAYAAYNSNKQDAEDGLKNAEDSLQQAQDHLDELQKQLEDAKKELAAAGADALLAAEDNKEISTADYMAAVLQHYYVPNSQELSEGQTISNFNVDVVDGNEGHLKVTYDILDSDGNVLRTVDADYGYTVSPEDGQVQLYTKELTYQYTNAEGETVFITKEEADALDGQVEIANYWTIDGYFMPIYKDYKKYIGTRPWPRYTSKAAAIASGMEWCISQYEDDKDIYKASIDFDDDWKCEIIISNLEYHTTGHFTALYCRVSDWGNCKVNEFVAARKFDSQEEAIAAVIEQAKEEKGAYSIDKNDSRLTTKHFSEYAKIAEKYINAGDSLWQDTSSSYVSYVSSIRAKTSTYQALLSAVANAKADFNSAQKKVESIKNQLEKISDTRNIISFAEMARLESQLKTAEEDYSEAKINLRIAKESLSEAKNIYNERFAIITPSPAAATQEEPSVASYEVLPEESEVEVEEEQEEEAIEEQEQQVITSARANTNGGNAGGDISIETTPLEEVQPTLIPEETTIEEPETPLAITLAGILQHGKWFAGLAGVSAAGAGVGFFEVKRRAAAKIIDKLNQ